MPGEEKKTTKGSKKTPVKKEEKKGSDTISKGSKNQGKRSETATKKRSSKEIKEKEEETETEALEEDVAVRKKIKPSLSDETRRKLNMREERANKQPSFKRGEWFRYKRLGTNWRRPRGVSNKIRLKRGYRPPKVRVGFGKPSDVRHLHPSGFREVMVYNVKDLEDIDPKVHAARIGSTVGTRKRRTIIDEADARGIRVLNRGVL